MFTLIRKKGGKARVEFLMRNNCNCPLCGGAIKQFDLIFICTDCKSRFEVKDEGLADEDYVCERIIPEKEAVCG